jgi:NADPH-dependent glutamate synthase beta subunit-like oxidoreductase
MAKNHEERLSVKKKDKFQEIEEVYLPHQAILEASRCLFCHDAPCAKACPADIDVAGFIRRLKGGNATGAAQLIFEANVLGGTCARVCPVEILCQEACSHTELSQPIAIGRLQRYAWEQGHANLDVALPPGAAGDERVAVVGAGPAGLAAAAELARVGYRVELFEAAERAGGVLTSGIPAYRLPQEVVDREVELIQKLGVQIHCRQRIGQEVTLDCLLADGFRAVFLGMGLGLSGRVQIPGENLEGVFWATELLARIKGTSREHAQLLVQLGKRVAVIGGGNVAIDIASSLLRLGAEKVELVCLEGPREMPAFPSEVRFALQEGVELHTRSMPLRILGDQRGHVVGLEGVGMQWKKPGLFVPRNAEPVEGTEFRLQVNSVVEAIGQRPDGELVGAFQLETSSTGLVLVDQASGQTSNPVVFAGGDVVNGGATVVQAVGEGKRAALGMHRYLQGQD